MARVAFVTNICPHYRVRTYEMLAKRHDVDYYFFSAGDDWYWLQEHGVRTGGFRFQNLPGFRIGGTRVTPTLPLRLWRGRYDVVIKCINGRFALPVAYLAARLARKPFILWTGVWMRLQTPVHRLLFPLTRFIYRHADAVVVYGDHVTRFLVGEGVAPDRIFLAPHAVDNDAYNRAVAGDEINALRKALDIGPASKVVLYVGRLVSGKGLDVLLDAFAAANRPDAVLVLVGTGPERARLEESARALGIADRVRFTGYVDPAGTVAYYALAWTLVLPSVTTAVFKEPWGLVVNEAFNQGVPVIATDAVGAAAGGLVRNSINGLIVPEHDASALGRALGRLIDDGPARDAMGAAGRRDVAAWDNEHMIDGFTRAVAYVSEQTN